MKDLRKHVILFCLAPFIAVLDGWVFSLLWRWFIVRVFRVPALSIPEAIGIIFLVTWLTHQSKGKDDRELSERITLMVAEPFMVLGIGAIVRLFL